MKKNLISLSVISLAVLAVSPAQAQDQDELKPGFYPGLGISVASDDNIYRIDTGLTSDTYFLINPSLLFKGQSGKHSFDVSYIGNFGYYQSNTNENYGDNYVNADAKLDLTPKFNLNLNADYSAVHEPRGAAGTDLTVSPEPNLFTDTHFSGEVVYGRRTNKGQFSLSYGSLRRVFTNNSQEARDHDVNTVTGTFYYNYSAKTSFLFESGLAGIDYVNPAPTNLDSTETHYFLGAKWEATAKTTGTIKAGSYSKDFKDGTLSDFNGNGFDLSVVWKPKSYSSVQLSASKYPRESSYTTASYYVSDVYGLAYRHGFSERVQLNANITTGVDTYSNDTRKDNLMGFGVGMSYKLGRMLELNGKYIYSTRDSNLAGADYKSNVYMITISTASN